MTPPTSGSMAAMLDGKPSAEHNTGFQPGKIVGTVMIWAFASGQYQGSLPFAATNSEQVEYQVRVDDKGKEQEFMADQSAVVLDLATNATVAIEAKLTKPREAWARLRHRSPTRHKPDCIDVCRLNKTIHHDLRAEKIAGCKRAL